MKIDKKPLTIIIIILVAVFSIIFLLGGDSKEETDSTKKSSKNNTVLETKTDDEIEEILNDSTQENIETTGQVELPKVLAVNINLGEAINCSWTSENAFSYKVSIGTEPKKDDVKSWTYTTDTTLSYLPLNYSKNNKYFCNVIATRSYLESEILSSISPVSYP